MADALLRAQVSIPTDVGMPDDVITNVWHFDGDDVGGGQTILDYADAVVEMLTGFYQTIDGVVFPRTIGSPAVLKVYNMREATPRVPVLVTDIPLAPTADTALPHEVAICLSFAAVMESGVPAARRRGRVYIGPIGTNGTQMTEATGTPRPGLEAMTAIRTGALALLAGGDALGAAVKWAIYSPTTDATSTIDDAFNDVTRGWIDNAFDTMRSRGTAPTARTTF